MDKITTETNEYGDKYWYLNGKYHRVDEPAVECANGTKYWYLNGKCHRIDGPAVEYANGTKFWFLNGIEILEKDFVIKTKDPILEAINLLKSNGYKVFKEKVELEEV
jgi:hypothetical protein